jgi:oxygen-independent coproporphyrinogen III oxidase
MIMKINSLLQSKNDLVQKYNVPGPRYTSYPTVPYWNTEKFTSKEWIKKVSITYAEYGVTEGISLYIHLPYCESLCTYCGCNTRITVNHEVERPYIEAVLQEWEMYRQVFKSKPLIKEIHLGGGTPTFFSPENLFLLLEGVLCNAQIADSAEFSFEAHPNNTTEEHLKVLYGLGFRRISLGIQDFDPEVQTIINRKQSYEQVEDIVMMARRIGYTSINFDLIYGLPLQTISGLLNTLEKVVTLRPDRIAFYSYAHVPWLKPGQRRYTEADLPDGNEKLQLHQLGSFFFKGAGYKEIGMDHFALPTDGLYKASINNTLHRNFMGYTASKTHLLVGLGCSSISDTWTAFAQNSKTVEEYIKEVKNGDFPVFKGHLLTEEDLTLRQHILNIMCRMETSWRIGTPECNAIIACIGRLEELINDKLVTLTSGSLHVNEAGKSFLRNICMAFDERLHRSKNGEQLFSKVIG